MELSFNTVMNVTSSWDKIKRIPNYRDRAGMLIYENVFQFEPKARELFHFRKNENIRTNETIMIQARLMADMIEMTINLLGPDLDVLREDLIDLGRRHVKYGVPKKFLPVVERAAIHALEELLGSHQFTRNDRNAWQQMFYFMFTHMEEGMS